MWWEPIVVVNVLYSVWQFARFFGNELARWEHLRWIRSFGPYDRQLTKKAWMEYDQIMMEAVRKYLRTWADLEARRGPFPDK